MPTQTKQSNNFLLWLTSLEEDSAIESTLYAKVAVRPNVTTQDLKNAAYYVGYADAVRDIRKKALLDLSDGETEQVA